MAGTQTLSPQVASAGIALPCSRNTIASITRSVNEQREAGGNNETSVYEVKHDRADAVFWSEALPCPLVQVCLVRLLLSGENSCGPPVRLSSASISPFGSTPCSRPLRQACLSLWPTALHRYPDQQPLVVGMPGASALTCPPQTAPVYMLDWQTNREGEIWSRGFSNRSKS